MKSNSRWGMFFFVCEMLLIPFKIILKLIETNILYFIVHISLLNIKQVRKK